jgi:hypothetical protein
MQKLKLIIGLLLLTVTTSVSAAISIPNLEITPGKLCDTPSAFRYPEGVPYCKRDVDSSLKREIFLQYNIDINVIGFNRDSYKIDHLIPLCVGGSNDITNLWPQHESAFHVTDPLETLLCKKMAEGKLSQADAVALVIDTKTHLEKINQVMNDLGRL